MGISVFVKSSFFGRLVYQLLGQKLFTYKEEHPDYEIPKEYLAAEQDIIVTWDGPDDPENPQNWPLYQKAILVVEIMFLTATVYMGSGIYTPGTSFLREDLDIPLVQAILPLSTFILGYAVAPLLLSPLSENAAVGRTNIYIISLFLFCIIQIPTAVIDEIAALCVLRFIGGMLSSPTLGTGAALMGDIISVPYLPLGIALYSMATMVGPSVGPVIGAAMVVKKDWHWTFWFICMLSSFCLVIMFFFLPETSAKTILYRKAQRIRKLTGNEHIVSEGELETKGLQVHQILADLLWRPFEIIMFEPVILAVDLHIAMTYAILNIWFEAFPLVFEGVYGMETFPLSLPFLTSPIGAFIGMIIFLIYLRGAFTLPLLRGEEISPEVFVPYLFGGALAMPAGVFIFAWSSTANVHWIVPCIGSALYSLGGFWIFQNGFNYMASSFPRYLASAFAGNNLLRSVLASMMPLAANTMYTNTGSEKFPVGWGCSILGFISVGMIAFPVVFYLMGPKLRARSKYSGY